MKIDWNEPVPLEVLSPRLLLRAAIALRESLLDMHAGPLPEDNYEEQQLALLANLPALKSRCCRLFNQTQQLVQLHLFERFNSLDTTVVVELYQLRNRLRDLSNGARTANQLRQRRQSYKKLRPVAAFLQDLEGLRQDPFYESRAFCFQENCLHLVTQPIALFCKDQNKNIPLGRFEVVLSPKNYSTSAAGFRIEALEPNPHRKNHCPHPHISSSGDLCLGNASSSAQRAVFEGRLLDALDLLQGVLTTYNTDSPFGHLASWYGDFRKCKDCGTVHELENMYECGHCHNYDCKTCRTPCMCGCITSCHKCRVTCANGHSACRGCLKFCSYCKNSICSQCQVRCGYSNYRSCSKCVSSCQVCLKLVRNDYLKNNVCSACHKLQEK